MADDIFDCYVPQSEGDLLPGKYGVNDAIESLRPGAMYQLSNTVFTKWWHPLGQPTWNEILDECERLKAIAYKGCRREEYPSIEDFIDAYYWEKKGDSSLMEKYISAVDTVKSRYPKP